MNESSLEYGNAKGIRGKLGLIVSGIGNGLSVACFENLSPMPNEGCTEFFDRNVSFV
jgi:hypothetical protein